MGHRVGQPFRRHGTEVSDVSVLTINGATDAEGYGAERRTWTLPCTDVFGRPYEMRITAYRGANPGLGVQAPTGEFGFVEADRVEDVRFVINEAMRFLGLGGRECIPNSGS